MVCLFDTLEQALTWQGIVFNHLPDLPNSEETFGAQFVVDANGDYIRTETRLLLSIHGCDAGRYHIPANRLGGWAIPAHVDRMSLQPSVQPGLRAPGSQQSGAGALPADRSPDDAPPVAPVDQMAPHPRRRRTPAHRDLPRLAAGACGMYPGRACPGVFSTAWSLVFRPHPSNLVCALPRGPFPKGPAPRHCSAQANSVQPTGKPEETRGSGMENLGVGQRVTRHWRRMNGNRTSGHGRQRCRRPRRGSLTSSYWIYPFWTSSRARKARSSPSCSARREVYGYLPQPVMAYLSKKTGFPLSRLYGVATFYAQFRLTRRGRHLIRCCDGTACHVRGAAKAIETLEDAIGLEAGSTSPDYKYTMEIVYCLGSCGLAPVAVIDDKVHGRLTPDALVAQVATLQ